MKKKNNKKTIVILLLAVCAVAALIYYVIAEREEEEEIIVYKEALIEHGRMIQTIMESGTVEFKTGALTFDIEINDDDEDDDDDDEDSKALRIEEVYIQQGERIRENTPVMKLSTKSVNSVRRGLRADEADAELTLENLRNELDIQKIAAQNEKNKSVLDQSYAEKQLLIDQNMTQLELQELQDSVAVLEQEIKQIEFDLEDGWEDYDDLREEYEKAERRYYNWDKDNLYKYIPLRDSYLDLKERYLDAKKAREDQREEIEDKQEEIIEKTEELERLMGKTTRSNLDSQQTHDLAMLEGKMAEETYRNSLKSLEAEIRDAEEELEKLSEDLREFDLFVGKEGIVYAKEAGLVTQISYQDGDTLKENSDLFTYVKEDDYKLTVDILEEDILHVAIGDTATIRFTAYPEETYTGIVEEIATTETSEETATVSYPVTINLQGDMSKIYGGMAGDATFITDQIEDADYVPRKAIVKEGEKSYVLIKNANEEFVRKEVQTGFSDGANVQIISDLKAGEYVYIESRVQK